ncbi:hypothetical protein ACFSUS_02345 [Spirosoma soli]|uniref:DUF4131 domain-containing protein n=1 Tax=Spirosoma soli TaxID=1770529 RepID=A0ABW5LXS1_9BACT
MKQKLPKRSNTFGIIATILGLTAFMVPRPLLLACLVTLTPLIALSFLRDRTKLLSFMATSLALGLLYLAIQEKDKGVSMYEVKYEVNGKNCLIEYTDATGGTIQEMNESGIWIKKMQMKGDVFIHLSARSKDSTSKVLAVIFVNDKPIEVESASGAYATASVSCQPQDVTDK